MKEIAGEARIQSKKPRKTFFEQAQREGTTVHIATPMHMCHLENSEMAKKFRK